MKTVPRVKELMNRKFVAVDPETRMSDLARLLVKKRVRGAAVIDGEGNFVGTVSSVGLMNALLEVVHDEVPPGPVKSYLDPESPTLTEDTALLAAAELLASSGYELWGLPVLRDGEVVGAVTRLDIIAAVMKYLDDVRGGEPETLYISALKEIDEKPPLS